MPNRADRRASGAKYPTSLDRWDHDRVLKGVEIPSASGGQPFLVDFELPNLNTFAKLGDIPNPIAEIAIKAEWDTSFNPLTAQGDDRKDYFDLMCYVIAWGLRKPNVVEELGSLEAGAAWVAKWTVQQQMVLWSRSQHMVAQEDIEAAAMLKKEVEEGINSVADLKDFRHGGRGADVSPNGTDATGGP